MPEKKVAKVVYHTDSTDTTGTVWMDVTQKTVTTNNMLSGITSLKNDGTDITGNIASKTSSNLTVSGATVTAEAGYYASSASASVASGTAGTPTATKGTVSNHQVSVTPSVTNTTGYITGSTKTGTAVTVTVSELESGTKQITENGTGISVSGYSAVDVAVSTGIDCPVFTMNYNSQTENSTITCNKTFSECYADATKETPVVIAILNFIVDNTLQFSKSILLVSISTNSQLKYIINVSQEVPNYEINYSSDGTITYSDASDIFQDLTVTAGGTYPISGSIGHIAYKTVTVASGTAGTPSASKGSVSNHSISVTPSVTNVTGYITGGTKTGTAVSVSASELVSGTKSITENGTEIDVTNYASVDVEVPTESKYKITITSSGNSTNYISYNNVNYHTAGTVIEFDPGDTLVVSLHGTSKYLSIDGNVVVDSASQDVTAVEYNYILPENNLNVALDTPSPSGTVFFSITSTFKARIVDGNDYGNVRVTYNNTNYYQTGDTFEFVPGNTLVLYTNGTTKTFYINDEVIAEQNDVNDQTLSYNYTLPKDNITIKTQYNARSGVCRLKIYTAHPVVESLTITAAGTYEDDYKVYSPVVVAAGTATAPSTISGSSATVTAGTNTITLNKTISVTPVVSTAGYISSGTAGNSNVSLTASVNTRTSSDLTASGATVTAPAGYYANDATKSVASGTEGTPTATKGTVSNHSVSVTPSVTNSAGYISGGTKTGTAVTVSASELVSGNKEITANGTGIDVANYSTVNVAVSGNGGSAISVVDTLDANGGTIRTITAVDISSDTVTAAHLESGYTAHDAAGNAITGTYSAPSATQHVIHFDFSDNSDTDINVYYDDSLISTMITAYTPTTYNNKTVIYASLDNTAWYEPTVIPLNTQLIDYTKCEYNKSINVSGAVVAQDWYYVSDFTPVETTMNFSYRAGYWTYIGFYNESQTALATVAVYNYGGTQDPNDSNTGYGNLTGSNFPAGTKYIRISGTSDDSNHMSLIRTA